MSPCQPKAAQMPKAEIRESRAAGRAVDSTSLTELSDGRAIACPRPPD